MTKALPPAIKWSGSKRSIAADLGMLIPRSPRFYDPFVGGGAMLPFRKSPQGLAGDTVAELVALWQAIQSSPDDLAGEYTLLWNRLQDEGHTVFYEVRDRFNTHRRASDLFFLSRTCVNGLIRFNARGEFNNSLHHTRPGIAPTRLAKILREWSVAIASVTFGARDYRETLQSAEKGDVAFLDPPYASNRGRYRQETFDVSGLFDTLADLTSRGVRWILTFDGRAGSREYKTVAPEELWRHKFAAPTGRSPFTRLMRTSLDDVVESIYVNFDPPAEVLRHFHELGREGLRLSLDDDPQQDALVA